LQYYAREHKASWYFSLIGIHAPARDLSGVFVARCEVEPLPHGYRQGIITAISVLLGFTLGFFRFWGFEAEGQWTRRSFTAAAGLTLALLLQVIALFRSLRLKDDHVAEYRITVRWFVASAVLLIATLFAAAMEYAGVF
jgi:hypothetical protein